MSEPRTPQSALEEIPGWEAASWRELGGGLSNRTWLVEKDGDKAVLKLDEQPRSAPYNERREEARIQTMASIAGLANAVLFANDTAYMTEYVEGVVWQRSCFDKNDNLDDLAAALRKLHALPLTGRTFDAMGAARNYVRQITGADDDRVRDCMRMIESMPLPHNLRCCHNDLVAANIITTPEIRFLDWEYACDNDPFFDLATVVAHHDLSAERAEYLLHAYFDGDGHRWRDHLARHTEFYRALLWLWEAARPATSGS